MTEHATLSWIGIDDYLRGELQSEVRHEYVAGQLFAMVGASRAHNTIVLNLGAALREHLRGGPCRAFVADMKVRVESLGVFYYPDVVVTCDPGNEAEYFLRRPRLIIEVLSPTTRDLDRREKLLAYRQLTDLTEYVMVDQERPSVEIHRRASGGWMTIHSGRDDDVSLESVGLTLPMALIYEDTES